MPSCLSTCARTPVPSPTYTQNMGSGLTTRMHIAQSAGAYVSLLSLTTTIQPLAALPTVSGRVKVLSERLTPTTRTPTSNCHERSAHSRTARICHPVAIALQSAKPQCLRARITRGGRHTTFLSHSKLFWLSTSTITAKVLNTRVEWEMGRSGSVNLGVCAPALSSLKHYSLAQRPPSKKHLSAASPPWHSASTNRSGRAQDQAAACIQTNSICECVNLFGEVLKEIIWV